MSILRKRPPASRLREAIAASTAREHLGNLPDYLAKLIEDFEARDVHPGYREDVYKMLAATVNVCRTVINPSFPAKPAIDEIGQMMTMLPRMLAHLTSRPSTTGWAIMVPHTKEIFPSIFSTLPEAEFQLRQLRNFSPGLQGVVIPVQLTSEEVRAPSAPKRTIEWPPAAPAIEHEDPIPEGIKPKQLSFDDLMSRIATVEGAVSGGLSPPVSQAPEGPPAADPLPRTTPRDDDESPRTPAGATGNANP
jgi:hypothetical protein